MQRTVLVTGATGLLGREVVNTFRFSGWTVKGTGFSRADGVDTLQLDLLKETEVEKMMDGVESVTPLLSPCAELGACPLTEGDNRPQVIVHCAAERFPDKVDKNPEGARALNVHGTETLARLAASRGVLTIYISTDYVFPGTPGEAPYEADATPQPKNLYGQKKLDGERVLLEEYNRAGRQGQGVVLRVPVLYGHAETPAESAVNVLMDSVRKAQTEGAAIKMDHWARRFPTNTEDVGRVIHDVATKYLDAGGCDDLPRILQFSSRDDMTKYDICQAFGDMMGLSTETIEPNRQGNDASSSTQRPYNCQLSTRGLMDLGIDVSTCDFTAWWRREVGAFRK